ncbi:MAG: Bax inhibitor-1/YccA family protein [Pseudomonadota bacterium]
MAELRHAATTSTSIPQDSVLATNKVLRNTYWLLALTLLCTAGCAFLSASLRVPYLGPWVTMIGYFALLFATSRFSNSPLGLVFIFLLTGFMGFTLGPVLGSIARIPGGSDIIMTAFGVTGASFLGLSAYAITSRRNFSFLGGFLTVGILGMFLLGIVALIFKLSTLSLVVSGGFLLLSGGLILWQTSEIVHGGERNYINATITLWVSIYNMFMSLLNILMAFSGDD